MTRSTLVVAAHCDDAALSIGGMLLAKVPFGRVVIATIFTRSTFTLSTGFAGDEKGVSAARKAEESAFVNSIGATWLDLDCPEASLRGYETIRQVFGLHRPETDVERRVFSKLCTAIGSVQPSMVLLPLAIGAHVDHVLALKAGRSAGSQYQVPVAFYEDLPYAARLDDTGIRGTVAKASPTAIPMLVDISAVLDLKLQASAQYVTQVSCSELNAIRSHAERLGTALGHACERLWLPQAALTIVERLQNKSRNG